MFMPIGDVSGLHDDDQVFVMLQDPVSSYLKNQENCKENFLNLLNVYYGS